MNKKVFTLSMMLIATSVIFAQRSKNCIDLKDRFSSRSVSEITEQQEESYEKYAFLTDKKNQEKESNDLPSYSHFSINTGLGKSFAKSEFTSFKAPIMLFWENGGNAGPLKDLIDIPNWIYYGCYLRYSKQVVNYYSYYSYNAITIGAGIRANVSVFPMIAALSNHEQIRTGPFDIYAGFQAGYDYVFYNNYLSYYGYYGTQRGVKISPFIGARFSPLKWLGFHFELGSTSGRYCTLGINFRKQH